MNTSTTITNSNTHNTAMSTMSNRMRFALLAVISVGALATTGSITNAGGPDSLSPVVPVEVIDELAVPQSDPEPQPQPELPLDGADPVEPQPQDELPIKDTDPVDPHNPGDDADTDTSTDTGVEIPSGAETSGGAVPSGSLPATGVSTGVLMTLAAALTGLGATSIFTTRRRSA